MPPIDTEGQPGPDTTGQPAGGQAAETASSDDEALLSQLESEAEATGVGNDQPDGEDELDDWEEDGKKYKVPKALKPKLMLQSDYTRKTQEVAETRRQIEAQKAEVEAEAAFHRENVVTVAKLVKLDEQLAEYRALTPQQWAQIEQSNPGQASALQRQWTLLKDQREQLVGELQQKQQKALVEKQSKTAKQYEDSLARIAKEIPNWSDERASKLNTYATANGFSLDELQAAVLKPHYVIALDKAERYDQLMAKLRAKGSPKAEPAAITPVVKIQARRNPQSSEPLDSDPPDVWLRKRNAQIKAAGKR